MQIKEVEALLKETPFENLKEAMLPFKDDERQGVKKILAKYEKKIKAHEEEAEGWALRMAFDTVFAEEGYVVGVDEVGRGPLAGPVVAAAVVLPHDAKLIGLKDSKKLTQEKREALYEAIKQTALAIGVGIVDAPRIDEINILQATFEAMRQALAQIDVPYQCLLVDGDKEIPNIIAHQQAIIKGDDKSASIAAASVIAKVTRDRMMADYAKIYVGYDWENNKGYGSAKHYEGIRSQGITPLHRKSFLKNEGIF